MFKKERLLDASLLKNSANRIERTKNIKLDSQSKNFLQNQNNSRNVIFECKAMESFKECRLSGTIRKYNKEDNLLMDYSRSGRKRNWKEEDIK